MSNTNCSPLRGSSGISRWYSISKATCSRDPPIGRVLSGKPYSHLVFPDTFEAIVSVDHKEKIARSFEEFVTSPAENVDRQLMQIRPRIEAQYGKSDHSFYKSEIRAQWDDKYKPNLWDSFISRARRYFETGQLEKDEIEYKVEIGRKLETARAAVLAGTGDWADLLKRALVFRDGNIIDWHPIASLNRWCVEHPDEALRALQAIWAAEDGTSVSDQIQTFSHLLPNSVVSGPGTRFNLVSVLLMGLDVEQYPPVMVSKLNWAYERTGYDKPAQGADAAALYDHALGFLDQFIQEASVRGLSLRHRLDAQSLVYVIPWSEAEVPPEDEDSPDRPADLWSPSDIEALAKELLWDNGGLQKIIDGLKDKRQAIFQGHRAPARLRRKAHRRVVSKARRRLPNRPVPPVLLL